jgi:hypothetical protein
MEGTEKEGREESGGGEGRRGRGEEERRRGETERRDGEERRRRSGREKDGAARGRRRGKRWGGGDGEAEMGRQRWGGRDGEAEMGKPPKTHPRWVGHQPHRGGFGGLGPPAKRDTTPVRAFRGQGSPVVEPRTDVGRGRGVQQHRLAENVVLQLWVKPVPAARVRSARGCVRAPTAGTRGWPFMPHTARGRGGRRAGLLPSARGQTAGVRHACAGRVTGGLRRRR